MYLIMQSYNELPISSKIIINFRFCRCVVLKYSEKIERSFITIFKRNLLRYFDFFIKFF